MPEMAARTLRLCLPPQKTPHAVRLLQEAQLPINIGISSLQPLKKIMESVATLMLCNMAFGTVRR